MDPGSNATGYGLVERRDGGFRLVECGVIRATSDGDLAGRLLEIHRGLGEAVRRLEPECVAVEGVFYGKNSRTAVVLAHARGVAVLTVALEGLPVVEYPPAEIKKAVAGTGSASKRQIAYMVKKHLGLREPPAPSDASDGCAVALCHFFRGTGRIARAMGGS